MQGVNSIIRFSIRSVHKIPIKNYHQLTRAQRPILFSRIQIKDRTNTTSLRIMSSSGPIYTVDYLDKKLKDQLQATHLDILDQSNCGCGMKFDAVIVSPKFDGLSILQRQRLVNGVLAEEMKHIHAFTMKTLSPEQWITANNITNQEEQARVRGESD